ncbi:exopolysaccharide biosynthesis polyprenyl glycosylphosphotransferase [Mycobacterium frederiksbergense]|uniref:Exopolysaccharide biosynthesis polyprenyl glycosylphosphotransferase n=1 Tax=Mycolicibacterium frederiksbergense TaxID=117567 RepID=A0ABT6KZX7_9MYCO|nr:sugar transferase [Mycolicibacterium frederiksbergense]MDH6196252.1 exopolysaccharide biosynthesis polyprenyl glycosylphosphotransferase [Mycolicibacterium frederiksbergense]
MSETLIEIDQAETKPSASVNNTQAAQREYAPDLTPVTTPVLLPSRVFERSRWQRRYVAKLQLTDFLVVCVAVAMAHYLRFGPTLSPPGYLEFFVPGFSVLFAIVWLLALSGFHSRSPRLIGTGIEEFRRVIAASFWTFGAIAIVTLLLKLDIARGYLAVALPAGTLGLVLSRSLWRGHMGRKRAEGDCQTAVLAIGERDAVEHLGTELTRNQGDGYQITGVCIPLYGPPRGEQITINGRTVPIVGGETHALEAIRTCGADTVAIAGTEHFGVRGIRRLLWDLEPMGVDLVVSTGVLDVALSRLVMQPIAGLPLLHIEKPQYLGAQRFQKRAFDFCFASAALIGTLPILLVAAIAIKITSKGPVFYASERIGIDGKPFAMLKLRTMVKDADKQLAKLLKQNEFDGPHFKIHDDPRITRLGHVLRRFSIDELPQFINVLRHEMSVVGPRPPLRREVEAYDCDVLRKLLVKPGITGLWQVSGRADLSWSESVRLDLAYVDNWSMVGDLLIIAKTLRAVFGHSGAY